MHLEDADLVGRAEAVLQRAERAVGALALALEREHAVHEVLEHARAGERALLRHVADEQGGDPALLGRSHEPARPPRAPARPIRAHPSTPGRTGPAPNRRRTRRAARPPGSRAPIPGRSPRRSGRRGHAGPSLSARSLTWAADSSPDTYRTLRPAAERFASAAVVIVDLPIPGAPPISTRDPGTSPPPSTRSNSPMPVVSRSTLGASTSPSGTGVSARPPSAVPDAPPGRAPAPASPRPSCSTRRSPDSGRATSGSRGRSEVQAKTVAERAIPARLSAPLDGLAHPPRTPSVRPARFDGWFVSALDAPLAPAEFVALDTETNGYGGDLCEMTEVGAVLVGGGELHETYDSLVRVERPLSRGIQRFTGITQGMVDGAPPPEEVLPEIARPARGARAGGAQRALRRGRAAPGVRARRARLAEAAGAVHGRSSPAASRRWCGSAGSPRSPGSLGIEVDEVHRALPDALTCARVFCALFPKLCANAVTVGDAIDLLRSRRRARKTEPGEAIPPDQRPDLSTLPDDPGVYVFRDERGKPLYVGKSVSLRSRARAHFCAPAGWTERAEIVDYRPTNSELGALVLENRLIKQWRPAGQQGPEADRPLLLPALPARHPVPRAGGGGRAGGGPRREHRPAREPRAGVGAGRPAHLDVPAAPLRADAEAPRAPVGVRADGPLRVALPGRPGPERLPPAARSGPGSLRGAGRRRGIDRGARPADASRRRRISASSGRRRCCAGRSGSRGWWTGSRACCARPTRRRDWCWRSTR